MKKLVFQAALRCEVCGNDPRHRCMKCRGKVPSLLPPAKPKASGW